MQNEKEKTILVQIKKIDSDVSLPQYQHEGDAGFDLPCKENCLVPAMSTMILPTGLAFAIPPGFEMQIRMRSGAARTTPLIIPNAPGTIDSGYRGEVGILVRNLSDQDWPVSRGERLAQGVIVPVFKACFSETDELTGTERGADGFGSTGKFQKI